MKLLVTGASGLLGTDICHCAEGQGVDCERICLSKREGFIQADIRTAEGLSHIERLDWDALVHTAAWRSPEDCESNPKGAFEVNVKATAELARIASERKARMLYISTDYVFPGTKPPYAETAAPRPLNVYGETKLQGERSAMENCRDTAILRIPFLYGWRAGLERCSLLTSTLAALKADPPAAIDDSVVRYPTCTCDVAEAVLLILSKGARGIHHFSGQDKTTRYGIALLAAELLGWDASKLIRLEAPPQKDAKRPQDAHLSMARVLSLGAKEPAPFRESFKTCLKELGLLKS